MSEFWCDTCCYPVSVGEVIPDLSSEGDGHHFADMSEVDFGEDDDGPWALDRVELTECNGPVRRIG